MNIQIVKPQPGPQAAFIQCTADVVCYGGARGGGKSWAIALDFWLHAERRGEDARGLILRKIREDLKDSSTPPGTCMPEVRDIWRRETFSGSRAGRNYTAATSNAKPMRPTIRAGALHGFILTS